MQPEAGRQGIFRSCWPRNFAFKATRPVRKCFCHHSKANEAFCVSNLRRGTVFLGICFGKSLLKLGKSCEKSGHSVRNAGGICFRLHPFHSRRVLQPTAPVLIFPTIINVTRTRTSRFYRTERQFLLHAGSSLQPDHLLSAVHTKKGELYDILNHIGYLLCV